MLELNGSNMHIISYHICRRLTFQFQCPIQTQWENLNPAKHIETRNQMNS